MSYDNTYNINYYLSPSLQIKKKLLNLNCCINKIVLWGVSGPEVADVNAWIRCIGIV